VKDHCADSEDEDKIEGYFIVFMLRNQPRKNIFSQCLEQVPLSLYLLVLIKLFKRNVGFNAQRGMKIVKYSPQGNTYFSNCIVSEDKCQLTVEGKKKYVK